MPGAIEASSWGLEMRGVTRHLAITVAAGFVVSLAAAVAAQPHPVRPKPPERQSRPAIVQQEPVKRQNFRARRADEFPPWEGFEDCPMAFPCVGIGESFQRRH